MAAQINCGEIKNAYAGEKVESGAKGGEQELDFKAENMASFGLVSISLLTLSPCLLNFSLCSEK